MRLGAIDYINLLPFYCFIKRYPANSAFKSFVRIKKNYPAKLNRHFLCRRIDAGFISSIAARGQKSLSLGIIAKREVKSVIVIPGEKGDDYQSATSNALARLLGLQGRVLIGDRALRYALTHPQGYIDLGKVWFEREGLPFVFGQFCYNRHGHFYAQLTRAFKREKQHLIPTYLLWQTAKKTDIRPKEILAYLQLISYDMTPKATRGLKRFHRALDRENIKGPRRFW